MEMSNEMRELANVVSKKSAENCIKCNHKCFMYVVFTYIKENGYEHFLYHYEHDSLPKEVSIALNNFLQIFGTILKPDTYNAVVIPWC